MITTNTNLLPDTTTQCLRDLIAANAGTTFTALALAVIRDGALVLDIASGVTDPQSGQGVVTPTTLFDLASLTKPFLATAFLALVSRGSAALDDAVVKAIPEFGAVNPRENADGEPVDPAAVTYRHLLTHMSGLPPSRDFYKGIGDAPTPPDQPESLGRDVRWAQGLAAICAAPFAETPGSAVRYGDLAFMLLGEATARLWYAGDVVPPRAHLGIDMVIWEAVCERLGLESPGFNPVRNGVDPLRVAPTEYDANWRRRRVWGEVHDENAAAVGGIAGHAGLFANAGDVAAFGQAWLSRDERLKIERGLMDAAVGGGAHHLGWMQKAEQDSTAGDRFSAETFGHTGFTGTSLWVDPQRALVVALLTNCVYGGRERERIHAFRRAVHDALAEAY